MGGKGGACKQAPGGTALHWYRTHTHCGGVAVGGCLGRTPRGTAGGYVSASEGGDPALQEWYRRLEPFYGRRNPANLLLAAAVELGVLMAVATILAGSNVCE